MEDILNKLITVGVGLSILAGTWLIWFISGVANNLFNNKKWSWKRCFEDITKTAVMGLTILAWVVLAEALDWYTKNVGMDITELLDGASITGLIAIICGGSGYYVMKAFRNFAVFIGKDHVATQVADADYKAIATPVKDAVAALYNSAKAVHEDPNVVSGEVLSKKETAKLAEMGSIPYVKYDVSTPEIAYNNLIEKGFNEGWGYQCVAGFKEFMFCLSGRYVAAGGAASGYASNPARDAVCKLGFTWHNGTDGLQDGDWAIWDTLPYGHVAMFYRGKWLGQNQGAADGNIGNPFNLMDLPKQGIVGYFRPNIYEKKVDNKPADKTPTPAPQPAQPKEVIAYTYQAGDTFGQVIKNLGLNTSHGSWGADGDVAYYTAQLEAQGIKGNIPVGTTIKLTPRGNQ